jgi:predicted esterase YcpF (UPF0227 family)
MPVQRKAFMIVYVHGFNSSPSSHKSNQLRARLAALGRESEFACPALPHYPRDAMALLESEVSGAPPDQLTLIGSSLGGFYATYLTEKLGMRSVLVNPAITPHEGLRSYLGPQKNLYTGDEYVLTEEHLAQLAELHVARPARLDRYLLLHTTGDELLDWRVAVDHYRGCRQVVVQGSDHGFREFGDYLDIVLEFSGRRDGQP